MKIALLLIPLYIIGMVDGHTLQLEQKAYNYEIREEIKQTPSFVISKEGMEAQKAKYEENMNLLYKQIELGK